MATNLDVRTLQRVLKDGPISLGALRRGHDFDPSALLRVVRDYPDRFALTTVIEDKHQHPAIEARSELSGEARTFVMAVRGGGMRGITGLKLAHTYKLKASESAALAKQFSEVVAWPSSGAFPLISSAACAQPAHSWPPICQSRSA
jgi:hypothetical protein